MNLLNLLKVLLQYFLPKLLLTRIAGLGANKRAGCLTKLVISLFVRHYKIDMGEAKQSDIGSYRTFNDFFIRSLRNEVRPMDNNPNVLVIPADGIISQLGYIRNNKILQAKNHDYTLEALLAGNYLMAKLFHNGVFVTIYLSLNNYHRIHMPCDGILREMIYVPGDLFSVNQLVVQHVPNLFSRNERVICLFDTAFGPMAQILVGATIVGSIETAWAGTITPPRKGIIKRWTWPSSGTVGINNREESVRLMKGQEMGRFKIGSTVINLFAPYRIEIIKSLTKFSITKIGQPLALALSTKNHSAIPKY